MLASKLIEQIQAAIEEHGDQEIHVYHDTDAYDYEVNYEPAQQVVLHLGELRILGKSVSK